MNKLIQYAVMAAVGVLVFSALLVPIVNEATTTETTFTNNGLWRMSAFDDEQTWEYNSNVWTLNDVEQISGTIVTQNGASNAVLGDNWLIRANGWIRGNTMTGNATNPITIVSNDSVEVIDGNTTVTMNHSGYGVDNNGAFIMTPYNTPSYVLDDSPIFATGQSNVGTGRCIIHIEGTIKDGVTVEAYAIKNDTYTNFEVSDVVIDSEKVSGYVNLYKLTKITAVVSFNDANDDTISGTVTYSSYVVPYEVTAELAIHADDSTRAIIGVIPIIVIVGLVAAIIGVVAIRRNA